METYRSGHNEPHSKFFGSLALLSPRYPLFMRVLGNLKIEYLAVLSCSSLQIFFEAFGRITGEHIRRGIEAVITGLTRNQFESNLTRVRIPPSPPKKPVNKRVCRLFLLPINCEHAAFSRREQAVFRRELPPKV